MEFISKLEAAASVITEAKATNTAKKTAGNNAAAVGFFSALRGKLRDKEEVKNAVSKEGKCNSAKSAVSKGQFLARFFSEGGEIAVTTEEHGETVYNADSFAGLDIDNLPAIAFSTLYTYVKKAEKTQDMESELNLAAQAIMEDNHNLPLNEIRALLGEEQFTAQYTEARRQAQDGIDAANASDIEAVQATIAKLPADKQASLLAWLGDLVAPSLENEAQVA